MDSPPAAADALRRRKAELEAKHGPWTAHNIQIAPGLFTISDKVTGDEQKLRRILQLATDLCGPDLAGRRVLDLACLEGMYGLEFARRGAEVVAVEGRAANLAKARFGAEALELTNIEFIQGDVRDISAEEHGQFDLVLCLGILYHLDAPDVFEFLHSLRHLSSFLTVIDTHLAARPLMKVRHNGVDYYGKRYREHEDDADHGEVEAANWASLDNTHSFEPTAQSLMNALAVAGFTSVHECRLPVEQNKPRDRGTFVAVAGEPATPVLAPHYSPVSELGTESLAQPARRSLRGRLRGLLRG